MPLTAMEEQTSAVSNISEELKKQSTKPRRKRPKRKKKKSTLKAEIKEIQNSEIKEEKPSKTGIIIVEPLCNSKADSDIVAPKRLENFARDGDLATLLKCTDSSIEAKKFYLKQLNILANILLMQEWFISNLRLLGEDIYNIRDDLSALENVCCLSIQENGIGICGHSKDKYGENSTKIISSPIVKELALTMTAPLLLSECNEELIDNSYNICSRLIDRYIDQSSSDMMIFARYTRSLSSIIDIQQHVGTFNEYVSYLNIKMAKKSKNEKISNINPIKVFRHYREILESLLDRYSIKETQNLLIPYFLDLENKIQGLIQDFQLSHFPIQFKQANIVALNIYLILNWWRPIQEACKSLYEKILVEQKRVIKTIASSKLKIKALKISQRVFANPTLRGLPAKLEEDKKLDKWKNNSDQNNFIENIIKNQNSTQSLPRPRRKRKHRRPHKKVEMSSEEPEEIPKATPVSAEPGTLVNQKRIKFPFYADRIIARFNAVDRDLYHTYSPISDGFIIKYGSIELRQNETFEDRIDTKYIMEGQVEYPDGKIVFGKFGVTLDIEQICYHREFKNNNGSENDTDLSNIESESNPSLVSEEDYYVEARLKFDAENDEIYGEKKFYHNSKFVIIEDARNNIIITLFKTENDNTIH